MVCIIAALGPGRVIGSDNGLPWNIPEEYQQFLDQVRGKTIIMGRVSWDIFSADLPDTRFIVVSRGMNSDGGILTATGVKEAIDLAKGFPEDVFIAGGEAIYNEGINFAERMHLSFIKGKYSGDRFFPQFSPAEWDIALRKEFDNYIYVEYTRKNQIKENIT